MDMPTPATKKKRPNSPRAPGISLRSAVAEVTKVYQRYGHGTFTRAEMASALGMSSGSGAFFGKAATLKEYALVEEGGGTVKVSPLFMEIYQSPAGSIELKRNALRAVRSPTVFARLLQQFSSKIPDVAALALRLETQDRFNRDRALEVATAFRGSLAEFDLIDQNGNLLPVRDDGPESPTATAPSEREDQEAEEDTAPGRFRVEVPLGPGRRAVLALPDDLTRQDTQRICAVLAAYVTTEVK